MPKLTHQIEAGMEVGWSLELGPRLSQGSAPTLGGTCLLPGLTLCVSALVSTFQA